MRGCQVSFTPRAEPLAPVCVYAGGREALSLAARALASGEDALARLSGLVTGDHLFLLAAEEDLPWVDGCRFLGRDAAAPSLLLPTEVAPDVPVDVLERALRRHLPEALLPLAILPSRAVVSLAVAAKVDRGVLSRWRQDEP
jgi:hypothetical protein